MPGRETVLVFLHPRCPCSRASVAQLARIVSRLARPVNVYVLLLRPLGKGLAWEDSTFCESLQASHWVEVIADVEGAEARNFGAATSGETVLYDVNGYLRFHGGVTPTRGHEGDNQGQDSLVALLNGEEAAQVEAPVYGCPLFESS